LDDLGMAATSAATESDDINGGRSVQSHRGLLADFFRSGPPSVRPASHPRQTRPGMGGSNQDFASVQGRWEL